MRQKIYLCVLVMSLLLQACAFMDEPDTIGENPLQNIIESIPKPEMVTEKEAAKPEVTPELEQTAKPKVTPELEKTEKPEETTQAEETAKTVETTRAPIEITYANSFYYDRLSDAEKEYYKIILEGLWYNKKAQLPASAEGSIDRVFQCVVWDHPEIFYIHGFTCVREFLGDRLQRISLEGIQSIDAKERDKRTEEINQKVDEILLALEGVNDPYEIAKYLYEYIIEHTEYDVNSVDNQNFYSVFVNQRSVCQGYAKAYQYLLQKKGIQAALISGTVVNGGAHVWNMIALDGEYYYVDVTWGDSSYHVTDAQTNTTQKQPTINFDYLCVTTEQLCQTHQIDPVVTLPVCVADRNNYYRREGYWFDQVNLEQLSQAFIKGYTEGRSHVTIQCANQEIYQQMKQYLVEQQAIFSYVEKKNGSVNYAANENRYSIVFWL